MKQHSKLRGWRAAGLVLAALLVPAMSGCTIADALGKRADNRNAPKPEPAPEVVAPEGSGPQDQRVTLYVLGVDGVD